MKRILLLVAISILLTACDDDGSSGDYRQENINHFSRLPWISAPSGFRYKLIVIEGQTFVATQGMYGYIQLTGPISTPTEKK